MAKRKRPELTHEAALARLREVEAMEMPRPKKMYRKRGILSLTKAGDDYWQFKNVIKPALRNSALSAVLLTWPKNKPVRYEIDWKVKA